MRRVVAIVYFDLEILTSDETRESINKWHIIIKKFVGLFLAALCPILLLSRLILLCTARDYLKYLFFFFYFFFAIVAA